VEKEITRISFECSSTNSDSFSAPSIIVFASYDRHTHSDERTIKAYHYAEYGEVWFDGHYVSTNARDMEIQSAEGSTAMGYEIIAGRFEDHLSVRMSSPERTEEVIIALPDNSKGAYIGLTGENCHIKNIKVQKTGEQMEEGSVRKIIGRESYIDRLESDIPNIQIDHRLSACTEGIAISDELRIDFHTMSLPSADLVWHCPYIIIFYSEDHMVGGKGYKEYALIKINGESSGDNEYAQNKITMKKSSEFPGWDKWKEINKSGLECSVRLIRKGNKIIVITENLGITIEHTTVISDNPNVVYAALTGSRVALTDIRIR
jgi:hypothetical protein